MIAEWMSNASFVQKLVFLLVMSVGSESCGLLHFSMCINSGSYLCSLCLHFLTCETQKMLFLFHTCVVRMICVIACGTTLNSVHACLSGISTGATVISVLSKSSQHSGAMKQPFAQWEIANWRLPEWSA